jgi:hypothetical protein
MSAAVRGAELMAETEPLQRYPIISVRRFVTLVIEQAPPMVTAGEASLLDDIATSCEALLASLEHRQGGKP